MQPSTGTPPRFVSRGGEKLAAALERFAVTIAGRRALDAGASTGGFTDCLLQHGAARVLAVDVGHGQLHERLRNDDRGDGRSTAPTCAISTWPAAGGVAVRRRRRRPVVHLAPYRVPRAAGRPGRGRRRRGRSWSSHSSRPGGPRRAAGKGVIRDAERVAPGARGGRVLDHGAPSRHDGRDGFARSLAPMATSSSSPTCGRINRAGHERRGRRELDAVVADARSSGRG